jgi:hypothetical protein
MQLAKVLYVVEQHPDLDQYAKNLLHPTVMNLTGLNRTQKEKKFAGVVFPHRGN